MNGIEAQVVMQRVADYAKDMSSQVRQNDLTQDFMARMGNLRAEHELNSVKETNEAEPDNAVRDDQAGGGAGQEKGGGKKKEEHNPELDLDVGFKEKTLLDLEV